MTLATLAGHLASLPEFARVIAREPERNMAEHPYVPPSARTRAELLTLFDERRGAAEGYRLLGPPVPGIYGPTADEA